jgi:hypothetical protein
MLDYFVAYKKLMRKVEYFKCISSLNSEVHFIQTQLPENSTLNPIADNQPQIGLPATLDK